MPNNIAYTYWNLLRELSQNSENPLVQTLLNSNSDLSNEIIEQVLQEPRFATIFMLDPVFAANPQLQKEFIQNFPYARMRQFNQELDKQLIQNQLANYYLEVTKNNNQIFNSIVEDSLNPEPNSGQIQEVRTDIQDQSESDASDSQLATQTNDQSQDAGTQSDLPISNQTLDPNQNLDLDSEATENIETEDEVSLKSKVKYTPGQIQDNEAPFVQNENQQATNQYNLNNPTPPQTENPDMEDSISDNKQKLTQKQQERAKKLLKRGIPAQKGYGLPGQQKRKAPKMSLLKKGVMAGAFSTVTAGSGLTLFQILFT